jgi:GAF domain-containing protein
MVHGSGIDIQVRNENMKQAEVLKLVRKTQRIMEKDENPLLSICRMLRENVEHYDWVGFYLVDPQEDRMLVLGPYSGESTEHTKIPFGRGICGQAVDTGKLFLVQDVNMEKNYLSCSPEVRSEIVLPIRREGVIVGELDIDSHRISPFDENDKQLLERICSMVSPIL